MQREHPSPQLPGEGRGLSPPCPCSSPGSQEPQDPHLQGSPSGPCFLLASLVSFSVLSFVAMSLLLGCQFSRVHSLFRWQQCYRYWNKMNNGGDAPRKAENHRPLSMPNKTFWVCVLENDGFLGNSLKIATANTGSRRDPRLCLCNQMRKFVHQQVWLMLNQRKDKQEGFFCTHLWILTF